MRLHPPSLKYISNFLRHLHSTQYMQDSDLKTKTPSLPYSFARNHGVLLHSKGKGVVLCYEKNKLTPELLSEMCRLNHSNLTGLKAVSTNEFQKMLTEQYSKDDSEAARAVADIDANVDLSQLADEIPDTTDLMEGDDDAPVVRLINAILSQAVREKASDIHVETYEKNISVRFRVDGVLREILSPKRELAPLLISRLKVMAKLDIAEKRIPQDGRISVRVAGHAVDIRLSTIPSAHAERVVLRLLDTDAGQLSVKQMQMSKDAENQFKTMLGSPHGIVLVTGPTGSGKTTTLYAGLTDINESSRNIMTIEDPVEYMLPGIAQTQVNTKVDMSFARGLRAILRQDPDVVMIGEIRDLETAEIAIQASLTGHLVLSTIHTNTAIGAVTRLEDMGVEPFLLSSSLLGVIAQRLVRKLCPDCKQSARATKEECARLGVKDGDLPTIYHANKSGCDQCNQLGYRGRAAIYEVIEVDTKLKRMIHKHSSEQELTEYAHQKHSNILGDGRRRVLNGDTSIEEVLRVTLAH